MKKKTPKLPANLRGKFVSRAAFAKMQAEKQRLERDIYRMVMSKNIGEVILLKNKWREKFMQNKWIADALREIAKKELPRLQEKYGMLPKLDSNPKAFK